MTALAMVLQYNGFPVDKCELADRYLDKGDIGTADFRTTFPGDPRSCYAYGCYAPAIVTAANRYLEAHDSPLRAKDLSPSDFDSLFFYTAQGIPVIVWCTLQLQPGHYTTTWHIDGQALTWYANEHCMVLLGKEGESVYAADPSTGTVEAFPLPLMESRYRELFRQAVILTPT